MACARVAKCCRGASKCGNNPCPGNSQRVANNVQRFNVEVCHMKKLTLALAALAACVLTAAAAKADSITVTGPAGTLPVHTTAIIDIDTSVTTTGGTFTTLADVTSGPDVGDSGFVTFTCASNLLPILCSNDTPFTLFNFAGAGVDTITASLGSLTGSGTVTFGSTTGTPEPGTLSLLAAALAGSLALRRRIAR